MNERYRAYVKRYNKERQREHNKKYCKEQHKEYINKYYERNEEEVEEYNNIGIFKLCQVFIN